MKSNTRLELAHKEWHHRMAELVSPPYAGTPEEYEEIKPGLDKAREAFLSELLEDQRELIEFLSENRIEVENFFADIMKHFHTDEIYDTIYNYYARNFPSRPKEEIDLIIKQKCGF